MKRKISTIRKDLVENEHRSMVEVTALLGVDPKSFRREKKQAVRRLVTEIYSPPRVTEMLKHMSNHNLAPGMALDLTTVGPDDGMPWDLSLEQKQTKVLKRIRREKPLFVIGSPPCTRFCTWQYLNDQKRDPAVVKEEHERAKGHLQFAAQVYREQIEAGRFFLHEHPEFGTS